MGTEYAYPLRERGSLYVALPLGQAQVESGGEFTSSVRVHLYV